MKEFMMGDGLVLRQLGFMGRILSQEIFKKLHIILNNNNHC